MEIRQLEAFNAVVASGSVTAAGRQLGRSQPVISRQVSDLESELGFVLFERTRPTITLTAHGAEFHQEVKGVLADLQQMESRVREMRSGQARPLQVMATTDLAHGILPRVVARMHQFNPTFAERLVVEEVMHETTASQVLESRADFAFISLPISGDPLHLHWCGQAPCQIALPRLHPLAGREVIHLEDVQNVDIITLLARYRMRYHLTHGLEQAGSGHTGRRIEVGSQRTALDMVRAGLGIALIDPFSLYGSSLEGIVLRPASLEIPYRIGVVSQASRELRPEVQRLILELHCFVQDVIPQYADTDAAGLRLAGQVTP